MDGLEEKGKIVRNQNNWKLAGQRTELSDREKSQISIVEKMMEESGITNIDLEDLEWEAKQKGIDERTF